MVVTFKVPSPSTDDMHELQILLILIADCMKDFSLVLLNDNY